MKTKLTEITPGTIIHCKNYEERVALYTELSRLGYMHKSTDNLENFAGSKFGDNEAFYVIWDLDEATWGFAIGINMSDAIEFGDLILPKSCSVQEVKRLTHKTKDEASYTPNMGVRHCQCVNKLGQYEDTRLIPEQIIEIDRLYRERCEEVEGLKKEIEALRIAQRNAPSAEFSDAFIKENEELEY